MGPPKEDLTPLMARVRTQADVLVPVMRRLRSVLGTEAANALVYPVLRQRTREWIEEIASREPDDPIGNWHRTSDFLGTQFAGDVDYDVIRNDDKALDLNVSHCRFADFFRRIGEPELGAILVCELDDHIADLSAPDLAFSRADTLMQGGKGCPFRYRIKTGAR